MAVTSLFCIHAAGQELYVYTEPASNMPAHSVSAKISGNLISKGQSDENRFMQRYTPDLMVGVNKKLMVHAGATFASMHTQKLKGESVYTYLKYRFVSVDEVHKHFRMAVFAEGAYSKNPFHYDELSLQGDHTGVQAGIIATQLWNKLAVSASASFLKVTETKKAHHYINEPIYEAANYSLSAGYLLLPFTYTGYSQTNVNLYVELLGQQALDAKKRYWDLAPAIQFIFNSNSKLNIGHRFQLDGNMYRMTKRSWLLSYEYTFLNVLGKKKR